MPKSKILTVKTKISRIKMKTFTIKFQGTFLAAPVANTFNVFKMKITSEIIKPTIEKPKYASLVPL
jgi:hypothetical protein